MDKNLLDDMIRRVEKENILNLVVLKDGKIVIDYNKKDEFKGKAFKINSCTKSIVSALIGIAMKEKLIDNVSQPISDFFPELKSPNIDKRKKEITLYHLLTMTSGFSWPEYGNWQFISDLINSQNWVDFVLNRNMITSPNEVFNYNSGTSHLLSVIISRAAGMNAFEYGKKHIFEPLKIENINWITDPQGNSSGGFGIEMSAYDMIKIGNLYLNKGKFEGVQIIPEDWINESIKPRIMTQKSFGQYGYQWWVKNVRIKGETVALYFAMGIGGQFIFVVPNLNMVAVFISNNYQDSFRPVYYMRKYILKMF